MLTLTIEGSENRLVQAIRTPQNLKGVEWQSQGKRTTIHFTSEGSNANTGSQ